MTDPSPNYKILHIEPCQSQASSSSGADMSVLQFQIFHLLRRCIPMEIRHLYGDHDVPRLNRITTLDEEIKTSVLLQGNADQGAARDMSQTLSSLEIPENSHAEIIQRISQVARRQQQQQQQYLTTMKSVNLQVQIGGITTESESAYHEITRMVNEIILGDEEEEEEEMIKGSSLFCTHSSSSPKLLIAAAMKQQSLDLNARVISAPHETPGATPMTKNSHSASPQDISPQLQAWEPNHKPPNPTYLKIQDMDLLWETSRTSSTISLSNESNSSSL